MMSKRKGPTRNRTGVARMSYIAREVMSIRTGSDNRYTIEPLFLDVRKSDQSYIT